MKVFGRVLWLAGLLALPGCITSNTLQAIKYPEAKPAPDFIDKVERASVTEGKELLICVEARLSNSRQRCRCTLVVPLAKVVDWPESFDDTNGVVMGECDVPRGGIVGGFTTVPGEGVRSVSVGNPIADDFKQFVAHSRAVPAGERTLLPVVPPFSSDGIREPVPLKFIYVDSTRPELFTKISLEEGRVFPAKGELYFALPFAVAGDAVLLPIEALYLFAYFASGGH